MHLSEARKQPGWDKFKEAHGKGRWWLHCPQTLEAGSCHHHQWTQSQRHQVQHHPVSFVIQKKEDTNWQTHQAEEHDSVPMEDNKFPTPTGSPSVQLCNGQHWEPSSPFHSSKASMPAPLTLCWPTHKQTSSPTSSCDFPLVSILTNQANGYSSWLRTSHGLQDARRTRHLHLKQGLLDRGFKRSQLDPCVFVKDQLILVIYVDDMIAFCPRWTTHPGLHQSQCKKPSPTSSSLKTWAHSKTTWELRLLRKTRGSTWLRLHLIDKIISTANLDTRTTTTMPQHQPLAFFTSAKTVLKLPQEMHLSITGPWLVNSTIWLPQQGLTSPSCNPPVCQVLECSMKGPLHGCQEDCPLPERHQNQWTHSGLQR